MQLNLSKKLGVYIHKIDVYTQIIDGGSPETYKILIVLFWIYDKNWKCFFFKKTFLLADISMDITFGIHFITLNDIKVNLNNQELRWRLYTSVVAIFTIRRVKLYRKNEFTIVALGLKNEIFIVHVTYLAISNTSRIYFFYKAQIISLQVDETLTTVSLKYSNITDVLSPKLVVELSEHTGIYNHAINLANGIPIGWFITEEW